MTLIIQKPTGAKLNLRQTYVGTDDPDAAAYIAAVETADGQALETATRVAIHSFVKGCKADGIWPAIKASCILAGARTLNGALVPLVGAAPSLSLSLDNYVYNRKLGIVPVNPNGIGFLNTNRANNLDPQNNRHYSVFPTTSFAGAVNSTRILAAGIGVSGSTLLMITSATTYSFWMGSSTSTSVANAAAPGFLGASRSSVSQFTVRAQQSSFTVTNTSVTMLSNTYKLFSTDGAGGGVTNQNIAFYSIGESLDLALLDARVTDLINAFGAAIP